jgi:hypothetical protein
MEGERWDEERMPPLVIGRYRGVEDTPLPHPGGPLGGTVGGRPPTAPPIRSDDAHGEKEE